MHSYADVEDTLATVFRMKTEQRGALKGRLKHLQSLGVSPASPGKGKRIAYARSDVYRWAVCLELAEFGLDPTIIAVFDMAEWARVEKALVTPTDPRDLFLYFHPKFMSDAGVEIPGGRKFLYWLLYRADFHQALAEALGNAKDNTAREGILRFGARYGAINLTSLKRNLDAALDSRRSR